METLDTIIQAKNHTGTCFRGVRLCASVTVFVSGFEETETDEENNNYRPINVCVPAAHNLWTIISLANH